jgi:hypothetical protein
MYGSMKVGKVIAYIVYLFTPEYSIRYVPREESLCRYREAATFLGMIKALFWIIASVLFSLSVACLH